MPGMIYKVMPIFILQILYNDDRRKVPRTIAR